MTYAQAVHTLPVAAGRVVEEATVLTVRGVHGTGTLHFQTDGRHSLLMMHQPDASGTIAPD